MTLLLALAIYLDEAPILKERMEEAVKRIKAEELKEQSFICRETLLAMRKLKR